MFRNSVRAVVLLSFLVSFTFTPACAIEDQSTNDPNATEQTDPSGANVSAVSQSVTGTWTYRVSIYKKHAETLDGWALNWLNQFTDAEHSALLIERWKPDGSYDVGATCNHGTCANDPTMTFKCSNTFLRSSELPALNGYPCDSVSVWSPLSGYHVCNDDTHAQYRTMVYGHYDVNMCADNTLQKYAPSCD